MINEIQYNPPQPGTDADFEWVELFNPTAYAIELEGWTIRDNYESDPIPSLDLSPNGFAVIAATEDFHTNFPGSNSSIVFIEDGRIGNGLNNDGDRLILEDSTGTIIDAFSYGSDSSQVLHCSGVAEGHSLERSPAGGEFVDNPDPTPGSGLAAPAPTPTPTPGTTAAPTITPTATPTTSPPTSPTPEDTTPPPEESPASPGLVLRAILIAAALALFPLAFWFRSRRGRKLK